MKLYVSLTLDYPSQQNLFLESFYASLRLPQSALNVGVMGAGALSRALKTPAAQPVCSA